MSFALRRCRFIRNYLEIVQQNQNLSVYHLPFQKKRGRDGSIRIKIKMQYNKHPLGEYMD